MTILQITGLCFRDFGPIDLTVESAQCVCISGSSGAGKTLMLRAIADLDEHQGHVLLDNIACESIPAPYWRQQVGMLPSDSQWWLDTVGEHLLAVDLNWLTMLGFEHSVLAWSVHRLSMGERQRLALVRLLCNYPRVLLLDEPTANLDAENTLRMENVIAVYQQQTQAAVLWISHNQAQVQRIATRHYQLQAGQLVAYELK